MQVLGISESAHWLRARGLFFIPADHRGEDHRLRPPEAYSTLRFGTPPDGRRQAGLAQLLAEWFECPGSFLFLTVVAQFEPHELDALLLSRRVYGETRWPDDVPGGATPGHLFTAGNPSDQRDVRDFLQTMLAFTFEGFFVQEDGSVIIWVADEVVEIRTRTPDLLTQPRDIVRTLGISEF